MTIELELEKVRKEFYEKDFGRVLDSVTSEKLWEFIEQKIKESQKTISTDIEELVQKLLDVGVMADLTPEGFEKARKEISLLLAPHLSDKSELKKEAVREEDK